MLAQSYRQSDVLHYLYNYAAKTRRRVYDKMFLTGALKMTDMKLTDQMSWNEIDGHENAGHVSGV